MIRMTAMIALAAVALAPAAAQQAEPAPQRVLVVVAHPDDELFMAPAIAAMAREGADVAIYYATAGDAGPGVSGMAPGPELAERRIAEAWCAIEALGVAALVGSEAGDGTLGLAAHHPESAALKVKADLERQMPATDLILTWGPDGGYGHADHRMVSALATQVVQALPAAERPALLYVGIPAGSLPPVPEMAGWATTDPALLTQTIAYTSADLAAAKAAAMCHVTQFDEASRQGVMGLFDATMWQGKVHFRPAF
ncbi:PIG-L family deacetylase [Erythrobacter donghaensis]|uniref:PIG-L family deacetylase n=1 Tax=Erythrobacter donghaensis TaxID=267135 RepID=UPI000A3D3520|nr:PIG-L family deacetylase [Erythrobacter donghaensis]